MRKPTTSRNRIIPILIFLLLLILCVLVLMGTPVGKFLFFPSDVTAYDQKPSDEPPSNKYVCSHYFTLLANEMNGSGVPFQTGEYENFNAEPPAALHRNFVSSGIYLPLDIETTEGKAVFYTIVAYWLSPEGDVKEDLVALGVEMPDGGERFFLDDLAVHDLQTARASMKKGVVFTATLAGFVNQQDAIWADCPESDFATRYSEKACLVGSALAEGNPLDVSSEFTGSFLFGWQLERTGDVIPLPVSLYIEEM